MLRIRHHGRGLKGEKFEPIPLTDCAQEMPLAKRSHSPLPLRRGVEASGLKPPARSLAGPLFIPVFKFRIFPFMEPREGEPLLWIENICPLF